MLQGSLEGVDGLDEGVLGDEAVERAAGLGGAWDSALRSLSSALPGPRSHLRCLPAERRPPELCSQKPTGWRVKLGERRREHLKTDRRLYSHSVRDAKSPSQATAGGGQEGTEGFLPWTKGMIGTKAPGPGHRGFNPDIIH